MITDIRTESPFWLMKSGFVTPHSALNEDIKADIAIIGGGISGALLGLSLARKGVDVVMLDRQHYAMGSTSASTALIQYDIDQMLHKLMDVMGEKSAVRAYELSLKALNDLENIVRKLKVKVDYQTRTSFLFAKYKKDVASIEKEYAARKAHGFDMELWNAADIAKVFPFEAPAALVTRPAATLDPYLLTHAALSDASAHGARLFDKTGVDRIERLTRSVILHTSQGCKVRAKKVVIACGYESVDYLPGKSAGHLLNSSYAFVTEPLPPGDIWHENSMFWDTGDPYIYGRTTADNRIVFGGEDEPFYDPQRRDKLLPAKIKKLTAKLHQMFPDVPFKVDYSWAGTFAETADGLPYIGTIRQLPHTYFALGYGGNGITFSQLAADILTDLLLDKPNKDAAIFAFDRTTD